MHDHGDLSRKLQDRQRFLYTSLFKPSRREATSAPHVDLMMLVSDSQPFTLMLVSEEKTSYDISVTVGTVRQLTC
jgi:hypothetical protein